MPEKTQILSLSGGGIRGLYTAQVIAEIEDRFNCAIADHADIICGTSIGGILALGLAADIEAKTLLDTIDTHRKLIFPSQPKYFGSEYLSASTSFLKQIFAPKYKTDEFKRILQELFEDRTMGDLEHCVLIPSINYTVGRLRAFKTPHNEMFYQDKSQLLVDVALATSAAPTYFPLYQIANDRYVDGGLIANNPVLMGIIETHRAWKIPLNDISALCIGTMGEGLASNHDKPTELGFKGWGFGKEIVDLAMSTSERLSFDIAKMLLDENALIEIDTKATRDQSHLLQLDNSSDSTAQILKSHARNTAGEWVNVDCIKQYMEHQPTRRLSTSPI